MGTPWLFTTPATTGTGDGATDAVAAFSKPEASQKYRAAATASATVGKATRTMVFRFICHLPYAGELGQQPGTIVVPPEPDLACLVVEPSGNVPVTGHGDIPRRLHNETGKIWLRRDNDRPRLLTQFSCIRKVADEPKDHCSCGLADRRAGGRRRPVLLARFWL